MDTLLVGGDHCTDSRGLPRTVEGVEERIQQALIRLSIRRGSLSGEPRLGSELHKLTGSPSDALDRLALSYVQEALAPMTDLAVRGVVVEKSSRDTLAVEVTVGYRGREYQLEVEVH